jgi:periplasmic nitrate reductase NapD
MSSPDNAINVCGIVVHVAPHLAAEALGALKALPGVEIVGQTPEGRVALTAIDTGDTLAIDQLTAMHRLPGVVAASLAYHVFEEAEEAKTCTCGGTGACHSAVSSPLPASHA